MTLAEELLSVSPILTERGLALTYAERTRRPLREVLDKVFPEPWRFRRLKGRNIARSSFDQIDSS